jgi:hypothetical protein
MSYSCKPLYKEHIHYPFLLHQNSLFSMQGLFYSCKTLYKEHIHYLHLYCMSISKLFVHPYNLFGKICLLLENHFENRIFGVSICVVFKYLHQLNWSLHQDNLFCKVCLIFGKKLLYKRHIRYLHLYHIPIPSSIKLPSPSTWQLFFTSQSISI